MLSNLPSIVIKNMKICTYKKIEKSLKTYKDLGGAIYNAGTSRCKADSGEKRIGFVGGRGEREVWW